MKTYKKLTVLLLAGVILLSSACSPDNSDGTSGVSGLSDEEILQITREAYVYAFPLILMDLTRQVSTNVTENSGTPVNQLGHDRLPASAEFRNVVKPNVDTLYSNVFLDLSEEPIIFIKPETDIYCTSVILDAYSNSNEVTLGTGGLDDGKAAQYMLYGPDYDGGDVPGFTSISVPTNMAWIITRTEYDSIDDLSRAHAVQDKMSLVPLSEYGNPDYTPPPGTFDQSAVFTPSAKIRELDLETYFNMFNQLSIANPGTAADAPALERFAEIGVGAGLEFRLDNYSQDLQQAMLKIPDEEVERLFILGTDTDGGYVNEVNSWQYPAEHVARFGTDYEFRMIIALIGFGANPAEMSMYPQTNVDSNFDQLNGSNRYVLRFEDGMLPPCEAFWSITVYEGGDFLFDNPIDRYAIRDKDEANWQRGEDGSVVFYLQHESPGAELESNWLPTPEGDFPLVMRLYLPEPSVLDFSWKPPFVERIDD